MTTEMTKGLLPRLDSRSEYFDYLEGYSVQRVEELREHRSRQGLVKSYMVETVRQDRAGIPDARLLFRSLGWHMDPVDEGLYRLRPLGQQGIWGLLETPDSRYAIIHTLLPAQESDRWVQSLIQASPWLDRVWLSAPLFLELWNFVSDVNNPSRYTRITFEHESVYDIDGVDAADAPAEDEDLDLDDEASENEATGVTASVPEDDQPDRERRSSKFTMVERISKVQQILQSLQRTYRPLHSITQLRIPAPNHGGHEFYFNGKVTDRSDSFHSHRQAVEYVLDLYRQATERAEQAAWFGLEATEEMHPPHRTLDAAQDGLRYRGAPVVLRFSETLTDAVFEQWVDSIFRRKHNRFRLWGNPISMGKRKVHVYGVDRHVWQPIDLELTPTHVTALLPEGTCGNTIHRLVTNVQRFVDPAVQVWIGDTPYDAFLRPVRTAA
jgi:hypothetical protein